MRAHRLRGRRRGEPVHLLERAVRELLRRALVVFRRGEVAEVVSNQPGRGGVLASFRRPRRRNLGRELASLGLGDGVDKRRQRLIRVQRRPHRDVRADDPAHLVPPRGESRARLGLEDRVLGGERGVLRVVPYKRTSGWRSAFTTRTGSYGNQCIERTLACASGSRAIAAVNASTHHALSSAFAAVVARPGRRTPPPRPTSTTTSSSSPFRSWMPYGSSSGYSSSGAKSSSPGPRPVSKSSSSTVQRIRGMRPAPRASSSASPTRRATSPAADVASAATRSFASSLSAAQAPARTCGERSPTSAATPRAATATDDLSVALAASAAARARSFNPSAFFARPVLPSSASTSPRRVASATRIASDAEARRSFSANVAARRVLRVWVLAELVARVPVLLQRRAHLAEAPEQRSAEAAAIDDAADEDARARDDARRAIRAAAGAQRRGDETLRAVQKRGRAAGAVDELAARAHRGRGAGGGEARGARREARLLRLFLRGLALVLGRHRRGFGYWFREALLALGRRRRPRVRVHTLERLRRRSRRRVLGFLLLPRLGTDGEAQTVASEAFHLVPAAAERGVQKVLHQRLGALSPRRVVRRPRALQSRARADRQRHLLDRVETRVDRRRRLEPPEPREEELQVREPPALRLRVLRVSPREHVRSERRQLLRRHGVGARAHRVHLLLVADLPGRGGLQHLGARALKLLASHALAELPEGHVRGAVFAVRRDERGAPDGFSGGIQIDQRAMQRDVARAGDRAVVAADVHLEDRPRAAALNDRPRHDPVPAPCSLELLLARQAGVL
eukprot:31291-Pelagococcus_subviridis.AAC.3